MDRTHIKTLIDTSLLLSPEEKAYWNQHLPTLTDLQCQKLQAILDVPEEKTLNFLLEAAFAPLGAILKA